MLLNGIIAHAFWKSAEGVVKTNLLLYKNSMEFIYGGKSSANDSYYNLYRLFIYNEWRIVSETGFSKINTPIKYSDFFSSS